MICGGFTQALTLTCLTLRAAGATAVAFEDPSAPRFRMIAEAAGLTVVPVACDEDGLRADLLDRSDAQAVLVTPAHQYPLGMTMSAARRIALIEWARRRKALIIEDDYDVEFRYDRQPVGALQSLDPERVIYAGTASKTIAPGLRLGWLSPPNAMREILVTAKQRLDRGSSSLDQHALADLIASGDFDRHVRRMRAAYRRRRDDLSRPLPPSAPICAWPASRRGCTPSSTCPVPGHPRSGYAHGPPGCQSPCIRWAATGTRRRSHAPRRSSWATQRQLATPISPH